MEDVLDLYEEPLDEKRPVVCFDESSVQLIDNVMTPISAAPGRAKREDYEYERKGTSNLFVFLQPLKGWREVKVTNQRTKKDFAQCMKDLVDKHFPDAEKIRLVMDKQNRKISSDRVVNENVIGSLKRFKIISDRYRNRRKRFGLRFNLIAAIHNLELNREF